jgi:hypothetical protein
MIANAFKVLVLEWQQAIYEQGDSGMTIYNLGRVMHSWFGESVLQRELTSPPKFTIDADMLTERIGVAARAGRVHESFTILAVALSVGSICQSIGTEESKRAAKLWNALMEERSIPKLWMADFDHQIKRSSQFSSQP